MRFPMRDFSCQRDGIYLKKYIIVGVFITQVSFYVQITRENTLTHDYVDLFIATK